MTNLITRSDYKSNVGESISDMKGDMGVVKIHKAKSPVQSFFSRATIGSTKGDIGFIQSPYDLYEIGRIIDTESYVSRAFQKKNNLIFKEGYTFQSRSKENLEYIKRRVSEIQYMSKMPFSKFLRELSYNLIAFSNSYFVKVRKEASSSGKRRSYRNGRFIDPVAAIYPLPAETVEIKADQSAEPIRYRQDIDRTRYREFSVRDVVHLTSGKRSGFLMGTPSLVPVKDDILALRRIEEAVESLIYKALFPIIHIKVGSEKHPAVKFPNGSSEVSVATELLENIDDDGGLVTSERISLDVVGSESRALRVESYLAHFKQRVFSGLGMSGLDFGEGDSSVKSTGEVLSADLLNSVIEYQSEIEETITSKLFDELLLESGRYKYEYEISDEDRVRIVFNPVDVDKKIRLESHALNLANSGGLTVDEFRKELGRDKLDDGQIKELMSIKIASHMAEIQARLSKDDKNGNGSNPETETVKTKSGNTKTKNSKAGGSKKSAIAKTKPKNQHTEDSLRDSVIAALSCNPGRACIKIDRLMRAKIIEDMSMGMLSYADYTDKGIDDLVNDTLMDVMSCMSDIKSTRVCKKVLAYKIVDKTIEYINNIQKGKIGA